MAEKGASRAWEALTPALSEWILEAVSSMGFPRMTPVQASTIPLFMGNKDVVVEAVTGSGKTLSFLIPVVERLLRLSDPIKKHHVGAIIISPTRELAAQIHTVLLSLLAFHPPSAAAITPPDETSDSGSVEPAKFPPSTLKVVPQLLLGGTVTTAQDLSVFLKTSPNLLIATPGRLLELLSSRHVHCPQSSFEALIMDEADRLLDLGFKDDLQRILQRLPKQRRTGLFSASVSEAIDQIIRVGLRNPVRIAVKVRTATGAAEKRTPASLSMTYILTPATHKLPALSQLLHSVTPTPQKSIIYLSTCAAVDYFQHVLPILIKDFAIIPLHGKHAPNVRTRNFTRFTESVSPSILLTTDVAARGLDIPSVDLVMQLDPPSDPKTFLHRCGRAGRAGRKGLAVTFLTPGREEDYIPFLSVRKTPIVPLVTPTISIDPTEAEEATKQIRDAVLKDRTLHEKAQRGFVSWVQSYRKHTASSIFRIKDIQWDELGAAWGLLKLPKMPELKGWEGDHKLGQSMNWETYAYKDKQREKTRKQELADRKAEPETKTPAETGPKRDRGAWSDKKDQKTLRDNRREKKHDKREKERWSKLSEEEKQKELELRKMIEKVKHQTQEEESARKKAEDETMFDGFD